MANEKVSVGEPENYIITRPCEPSWWIRASDWGNLKTDVKAIGESGQGWVAAFWGLLGLSVAFAIPAITLFVEAGFLVAKLGGLGVVCSCASFTFLLGSILSAYGRHKMKGHRGKTKEWVVTEMERIEGRSLKCEPEQNPSEPKSG